MVQPDKTRLSKQKKSMIRQIAKQVNQDCFNVYRNKEATLNCPLGFNNKVGFLLCRESLESVSVDASVTQQMHRLTPNLHKYLGHNSSMVALECQQESIGAIRKES